MLDLVSILDLFGRYGVVPGLFVWALIYIKSEHALNRKESGEREKALSTLINGTIKEMSINITNMNQLIMTQNQRFQDDIRMLAEANRFQRDEHKDQTELLIEIVKNTDKCAK